MAETFSWVDADGGVHPLTDDTGARVMKGVDGRFMPPVALIEEEVPFMPGAYLRHTKTLVREIGVPVVFLADDAVALRSALRDWLVRLNVDRGPGKLRVEAPDAGIREVNAIYSGGMEIVEEDDTAGATWQKVVLVFRCHDPYWYDQNELVETFTESGAAVTFFPFFPLALGASEFNVPTEVFNDGDVDAWPTWRITGPGVDPTIRNETTGKEINIVHTLIAGEYIDIDTRPGAKTVVDQNGDSLYEDMTPTSALFPLITGLNELSVEMSATTSDSLTVMRYRRRYLGG